MTEVSYKAIQRKDEYVFICNLVYLRETNNLKQREVWEKLSNGLKFSTYQAWEERRSFPPIFFCRKIAEVFGYDLTHLLTIRLY